MNKFKILFLSAMLSSYVLSGCGGKSEPAVSSPAETEAVTEAVTASETEMESETEPVTEAPTETETEKTVTISGKPQKNEDGSYRAWIESDGRLNVRDKASKEGSFIGTFSPRQEIKVLEKEAKKGFFKVSGVDYLSGTEVEGFASADYISFTEPEPPAVRLDVVSFLQTDDRWKDMLLGDTKKNMYDIGCATTSLAMSESFLKGETITPAEIAEDAFYTSGGEIEWPMDYYWNYNKSGYLTFIYNRLHEGVPVLYGGAKENGRPHWILITGYTGDGEDLKPRDFVINDPLPFGRTNLQQYLDVYPRFNKLIYYCKDRALVEGSEEWKAIHEPTTEAESESSKQKDKKKN